jgi:hypothetical protein
MPINHTDFVSHRPWHLLLWALAGAAVLFLVDLATTGFGLGLLNESGGIEMASALLYAYAAIVWLWTRPGETWKQSWQVPTIMLMMMGREFDLDKKLTSVGILRSDLYLTNMAPILERVLGALVIAFAVTVIVRVIALNGPVFLKGLRSFSFWAWSLAIGAGFAVVSKSVDGLGRKLAPFGITIDSQTSTFAFILEELLEFGIPIMFIVAVIASIRLRSDDRRLNPK